MNFHDTTLSAILATLIAAGLIALDTSYLWKHRGRLQDAFKKKETRKETVEIERFIKRRAAVEVQRR